MNVDALVLTVLCLALGVLWRGRLRRLSLAPFMVLAAGALAGALWFRDAPTIGTIPVGLPAPDFSAISVGFFLRVVQPAFSMALLASIATLMIALRLDSITGSQHQPNREMAAQGIGKAAIGLRHIGRDRITADLVLGLEHPKVKTEMSKGIEYRCGADRGACRFRKPGPDQPHR